MLELALEVLPDALEVLLYTVGAGALTVLGLLAENAAVANHAAGQDMLAGWLVFMGLVALYAGTYLLGYRRLLPRLLAGARRVSR